MNRDLKFEIKGLVSCLFIVLALAFAIAMLAINGASSYFTQPIEQTKTFKVSCKSFDYDGEVFRDGKKFYELVGGKEIWIPLGDCLLREVE